MDSKEYEKMTLRRKLYEELYFIWFGIKELLMTVVYFLEALKTPKMWSAILYGSLLIAAYTRNAVLARLVIPLVVIVYFIRQKKDTRHIAEIYERDLRKNIDSNIVKKRYERYKDHCFYAHKEPMSFEEWKAQEIEKIDKTHKSDQSAQP